MATLKVPAGCRQLQELDSVQDTLADILSQLQDIDPSRLSLSPFLDLDTQISLAPVSDSPESSVEELRSTSEEDEEASPSLGASFEARAEGQAPGAESPVVQEPGPVVGLDPPGPAPEQSRGAASGDAVIVVLPRETSFLDSVGAAPCWEQPPAPSEELAKVPQCPSAPCPLPRDDQPPPSLCTPSPEEPAPSPPRGRGCSPQCSSAHLKAVSSAFVSLLLAPWILYGLHHLLPFEPPLCPDLASRLAFALRCLLIASVPVVLGVALAALARLCSGTLDPLDARAPPVRLHQLYVSSSMDQLVLFCLNAVVLATFLAQEHLHLLPLLAGLFSIGRCCYWASLRISSAYRGFGFGLSFFPALAMTAYNLFCLYQLGFGFLFAPAGGVGSWTTPAPPPTLAPTSPGN
ncbi:transmembrane protein 79 [Alligator mississippiensis]|uniref:Transmembrane protein 79-like n=1 Tax=Alligator mississippiensis TaxID=8496 RepID=A0A151NGG2_ALLMI|nr:transmembrane protein 79 [Alligator mississippiensis]KYO35840.1 transmembrane protein 79-like [Alligator mississippiensis]